MQKPTVPLTTTIKLEKLIKQGKSNKEIANEFNVTAQTIKKWISKLDPEDESIKKNEIEKANHEKLIQTIQGLDQQLVIKDEIIQTLKNQLEFSGDKVGKLMFELEKCKVERDAYRLVLNLELKQ